MNYARTVSVTLLAVLAAVLGDIYLSMALRSLELGPAMFLAPQLWLAIGLLFTHFLLWLAVLSWADLSLAFPLKASYFVFNALLVGAMLDEPVSAVRWLGTFIVAFGVLLVSLSAQPPGDALAPPPDPGGA